MKSQVGRAILGLLAALLLFVAAGCLSSNEISGPVIYDSLFYSDTGRTYMTIEHRALVMEDCDTAQDLQGIRVAVLGLNRFTLTDANGNFRLDRIPDGVDIYLSFSRSDIYTQIQLVQRMGSRPLLLHHHHNYYARFDSAIKFKPMTKLRAKDTLVVGQDGISRLEQRYDTLRTFDISVPMTALDDVDIPNISTRLYLIISRKPIFDPLDSTTYDLIKQGSGGGGVGITLLELEAHKIYKGDTIYYAGASSPRCTLSEKNPDFPTPGRRMTDVRMLVVP